MPDPSPLTLTVLNSNFLQLGRMSGGRPQRTGYPRRLPVNSVIHTTLAHIEPTTFRLLVRRATSSATDSGVDFSPRLGYAYSDKFTLPSSSPSPFLHFPSLPLEVCAPEIHLRKRCKLPRERGADSPSRNRVWCGPILALFDV